MSEFTLDDMLRIGAENSRLKARVAELETAVARPIADLAEERRRSDSALKRTADLLAASQARVAELEKGICEIRRDLHDADQQAPGKNVEVREAAVVNAIDQLDALYLLGVLPT